MNKKISRNMLYIILRDKDYTYRECTLTTLRTGNVEELGCDNCIFRFISNDNDITTTTCVKYKYDLEKCLK